MKLVIQDSSDDKSPEEKKIIVRTTPKKSKISKGKLLSEGVNKNCHNNYDKECNEIRLKNEIMNRNISGKEESNPHLYPILDDPNFNIRISEKAEFHDTKYDGTIHKNIQSHANKLAQMDFELQPHQNFVKTFLSFETPYNSLLLYHGLGTGKTCSAIGVCEEMRGYLNQIGHSKRIIIVANENVQDNFRKQLFDESRLTFEDGIWKTRSCIGNSLIQEVHSNSKSTLSKEKLTAQIKNLINLNYIFLGYEQFANYIIRTVDEDINKKTKDWNSSLSPKQIRKLKNEFDNRLIVIDEVHNIRKSDDDDKKKIALQIDQLVRNTNNMRFLFLSATPMFNSHTEIIWLLNIMNINDNRGTITNNDVFNKNGDFKEGGKELLLRKAQGYISFVRGENPYTFPYRIYPELFSLKNTFKEIDYPKFEMNNREIDAENRKQIFQLFLSTIGNCKKCGECQYCNYLYSIEFLRKKDFTITTKTGNSRKMPKFEDMESFGYTTLMNPIENLIISYPHPDIKDFYRLKEERNTPERRTGDIDQTPDIEEEKRSDIYNIHPSELTGKKGLDRVMKYIDTIAPPEKGSFEYNKSIQSSYGNIFECKNIEKYSKKIKTILNCIADKEKESVSDGIILIYSQYIDSGLIPMALALEEFGFTRFGNHSKPLFKQKPSEVVDVRTMKSPLDKTDFKPAKYIMITGDKRLSPNNDYDVKAITAMNNLNGVRIKVVLISKAGSEGIDFKFIRQVHILEPWYNINRIEQIIGRAVRNLSHKDLPFEKRNVQIYLHGTILSDENIEEAADLYVYRAAQEKAKQMGKVARALKETSVDCILNHEQTQFTQKNFAKTVKQELSIGYTIKKYKIGDEPFSSTCDFMENCEYKCAPDATINESNITFDTYGENFINMNSVIIKEKIKTIFRHEFFYKKRSLMSLIRTPKAYTYSQIYFALTSLIDDETELLIDKYGRTGKLINIGEYYLFRPLDLKDKNSSLYEISNPVQFKQRSVLLDKQSLNAADMVDLGIETIIVEGESVLNIVKSQYNTVKEHGLDASHAAVHATDDWATHCGMVLDKMAQLIPESQPFLDTFVVRHFVDSLEFKDKINLLNYVFSIQVIEQHLIGIIKAYFDSFKITTTNNAGYVLISIILFDETRKRKLFVLNKDNVWTEGDIQDTKDVESSSEYKHLKINETDINDIVGFMGYENTHKYLVFKTKVMATKRNTGARCAEAGKHKTIQMFNSILKKDKLTKENTKQIKDKKGNVVQQAISQIQLCIMQELTLRYFQEIRKDKKWWFFTEDQMLLYNI